MDAYRAVISLHNLGYKLMALEGHQIAICPAVTAEHAELIQAIRKEPKEACRAIHYLPQLCLILFPAELKQYAADLFRVLNVQIVTIRYAISTGQTEWVFIPADSTAYRTMREIISFEWEGVIYIECQEEGKRWRT